MNRLFVLSALCAGCSTSTATPESEANQVDLIAVQAELASLRAVVELNTAKVGVTTEQAGAIVANTAKAGVTAEQADAIVANTAKAGVTAEQADAIVANTAKTGVTTEQAQAVVANTAKTGVTAEQAEAILANTAKVGLSEAQIETLRHAANVADTRAVSDTSTERHELPRYTGNETPFQSVDITIPADGRYLVIYNIKLTDMSLCRLRLNSRNIVTLSNLDTYTSSIVQDLSVDDTLDIRCSGNTNGRFHTSSTIMATPIL